MSASDKDYLDDVNIYPFGPEADDDFYYAPPSIAQRLDLIQYLIEYSGQFLLVVGERGAGKSAMIRQLLRRAGNVWRICHIEATAMLDVRSVQRQIAEAFDWTPRESELQDQDLFIRSLEKQVEAFDQTNVVPVIIVDNGHELPAESMILLLTLAKSEEQREQLHIALFCEPHIHEMLNSPRLRTFQQSIMHVLDVPALTEDQVLGYVESKCTHAGLLGELPFGDETLDIIQQRSNGLPGRINSLAHQAMLGEDLDSLSEPAGKPSLAGLPPLIRNKTQLLMLAALLGVATLLIALNSMFSSVEHEAPEDQDSRTNAQSEAPTVTPPIGGSSEELSPDTAALAELEASPSPVRTQASPAPTIPRATAPQSTEPPHATLAKPTPSLAPTPPPKPTPTERPRPLPTPTMAVVTPKPPAASLDLPGIKGPDWLLSQPSPEYVLQLFGTHDRAALKRFIATHGLHDRMAWFSTNRDGKNWYVLVQGPFQDHNKAVSAITNLPPGVRALKPWARSLRTVRDAMGSPAPDPTPAAIGAKPTPVDLAGKRKPEPTPRGHNPRPAGPR